MEIYFWKCFPMSSPLQFFTEDVRTCAFSLLSCPIGFCLLLGSLISSLKPEKYKDKSFLEWQNHT